MFFEEFIPGMKFESKPRRITQDHVKEFAKLTGDLNPLHLSNRYAKRSKFGRTVVHGLLTLSIALGRWYSLGVTKDTVVALVSINNLSFRAPAFPGDSISLKTKVLSVRRSRSKVKVGLVTLGDQVINEYGSIILEFERTLMLRRKDSTK